MLMASVTAMHEEMHQEAGRQEEIGQKTQYVGPMFREEQGPANPKKGEEGQAARGRKKAFLSRR